MKSSEKRYLFAQQIYCSTDRTIPEIAELTGIPQRSLYHRAKEYKWADLRRASLRSPAVLVEEMYRELSDMTFKINQRPEGQRVPTPEEAELRRKVIYSITAVKKFPSHAEVVHTVQSIKKYVTRFYYPDLAVFTKIMDAFMAHRDLYGHTAYQPEFENDLNAATDVELEEAFRGPLDTSLPEFKLLPEDKPVPGQELFSDDPEMPADIVFPQDKPINWSYK